MYIVFTVILWWQLFSDYATKAGNDCPK